MKATKTFFKKISLVITAFVFVATTSMAALIMRGQPVYADSCGVTADMYGAGSYSQLSYLPSSYSYYSYLAQPKGISLDQAATFVQDMSDITGAYYDQATNRVVLVGTKNTSSTPVFNKDDFAVAVRALVFNDAIPQVSIGNTWTGQPTMDVTFNGQLENTNFGSVLENADYQLKQYFLGYYPNQQPISSSVPSYRSAAQRFLDQNPGSPSAIGPQMSSFRIVPQQMTLQKNDATNSFVFTQATMQVLTTAIYSTNVAAWNNAVAAWGQDLTTNYDSYAQELPYWQKVKELAKVVAMVKWLKDNNIATDYSWAKNYTPATVPTDTSLPTIYTPNMSSGGYAYGFAGGITYQTPNTYTTDSNSSASSLETTTEAAAPSQDATNWTYTQNGQQYQAVAVNADAFRSVGAYNAKVTDVSIKTDGNTNLGFTRTYNSQASAEQSGNGSLGNGWDWTPASLTAPQSWYTVSDAPTGGYSGLYFDRLIYQDINGDYETFTYDTTSHSYLPDRPDYHTKIVRNSDGSYSAVRKDQTYYLFGDNLALLAYKDKNNNGIYYQYNNPNATYITAIVDDNNHTLTINHDSAGRVSSVVDWTGRTTTYGYDGQSNLVSVTDPRNNTVHYGYDSSNRLTSITDRLGRQLLSNTYDTDNRVSQSTNGSGLTVGYTYDTTNRVVTATDNNGYATQTHYDNLGRMTEQDDPYGNATLYSYGNEASPLTIRDKRGNTTTYAYDSNGNATSVTYPDSTQVTYQYNPQNMVTQVTDGRYSPAKTTSYTYDTHSNILSKNEAGVTTNYTYNSGSGDMASSSDGLGHKTTFTYDNLGDTTQETNALGAATHSTYDSLGRLTQTTDPKNNSTTYTYDNDDNTLTVANATGTTTNAYDAENELASSTSPDSQVTQYTYNSANSQTSTNDALTNLTSYGYDTYNNIVSKQNALSNTSQYAYDKMNRATQSTNALGKVKKWQYDANGNITQSTDESNRVTSYTYDSLNRLATITYPNNATATYTRDARGNVTKLVDPSGTTTYTYDAFDRPTNETDPNGNAVSYGYDSANNLTQVTYPGGKTVGYSYDAGNQLRTAADWNAANTYYQYNSNGSLASTTLPNGIMGTYGYDSSNRLANLTYTKNQNIISKYAYTRDANGNVTHETDSTPQSLSTYTIYDDALHSGWSTSWSWGSTINTSDTSNPYSGSKDISWKVTSGGGGLHIRSTTGMISITPYNTISFAMKSTQSGQRVGMDLKDANDNNLTSSPVDIGLYGGNPNSSGYTVYNIPLSVLAGSATQISGLDFVDLTNASQPNMYVDSINLSTATASPLTMYSDGLAPKFADWSWDATNNFADTNPYQGTKDIATNITAAYGGLLLYRSSGFSTTGYNYLSFAVKGSQPGQDLSMQLSDVNGNGIGSELHLSSYGEPVDPNNYTVYNIPLADLQGSNTKVYGIVLQDQAGLASQQIKVDEIKLLPSLTTTTTDQQVSYGYDSLNRLTSAQYPSATYAYAYDSVGNRSSATVNGTTTNATFNAGNQLTSIGSRNFTYDNQGNEVTDNTKTFSYDYTNNLTGFTSTSPSASVGYTYNAQNQRLSESVSGTPTYQFVSNTAGSLSQLLETKDIVHNTQTYYTYGPGILSQGGLTASSRQYFLTDGLGNVRSLTDNSGNNVRSYGYDPFGNQTTGGTATNFTYQGQLTDPQTGLTYLRARYYDPTTGAFLSHDPLDGTLGNPQTQNGYNYANDNPINMSDPTGQSSFFTLFSAPLVLLARLSGLHQAQQLGNDVRCGNYVGIVLAIGGYIPGDEEFESLDLGLETLDSKAAADLKPLSNNTIQEMQSNGFSAHGEKNLYGGSRLNIYKDRNGNLYTKPLGGQGPAEPLGENMFDYLK